MPVSQSRNLKHPGTGTQQLCHEEKTWSLILELLASLGTGSNTRLNGHPHLKDWPKRVICQLRQLCLQIWGMLQQCYRRCWSAPLQFCVALLATLKKIYCYLDDSLDCFHHLVRPAQETQFWLSCWHRIIISSISIYFYTSDCCLLAWKDF